MSAEIIKKLRTSCGFSQNAFAKMLGMPQPNLCFIEAGKRKVSFKIAFKIINFAKNNGILITIEDLRPEIS